MLTAQTFKPPFHTEHGRRRIFTHHTCTLEVFATIHSAIKSPSREFKLLLFAPHLRFRHTGGECGFVLLSEDKHIAFTYPSLFVYFLQIPLFSIVDNMEELNHWHAEVSLR